MRSFLASCAVHAALLFGTSGAIVQPARYDVQTGSGGMEVSLIAAPLPPIQEIPAVPIPAVPTEQSAEPASAEDWIVDNVPVPPPQDGATAADPTPASPEEPTDVLRQPSPVYGDGSSPVAGNDPTTLFLSGGALGGTKGRWRNPAPPYPYPAIQQKQEGSVLLEAVIDKTGRPVSVEILQTSGFTLLDQSALRTVRRWKFDAAHIGFLPTQSKIHIPIRFVLDERFTRSR